MEARWLSSGIFAILAGFSIAACGADSSELADEDEIAAESAELDSPILRFRWRHLEYLPRNWFRCLPDPYKKYLFRDPDICSRIRFFCEEGHPFFDDCGCGCTVRLETNIE